MRPNFAARVESVNTVDEYQYRGVVCICLANKHLATGIVTPTVIVAYAPHPPLGKMLTQ